MSRRVRCMAAKSVLLCFSPDRPPGSVRCGRAFPATPKGSRDSKGKEYFRNSSFIVRQMGKPCRIVNLHSALLLPGHFETWEGAFSHGISHRPVNALPVAEPRVILRAEEEERRRKGERKCQFPSRGTLNRCSGRLILTI